METFVSEAKVSPLLPGGPGIIQGMKDQVLRAYLEEQHTIPLIIR